MVEQVIIFPDSDRKILQLCLIHRLVRSVPTDSWCYGILLGTMSDKCHPLNLIPKPFAASMITAEGISLARRLVHIRGKVFHSKMICCVLQYSNSNAKLWKWSEQSVHVAGYRCVLKKHLTYVQAHSCPRHVYEHRPLKKKRTPFLVSTAVAGGWKAVHMRFPTTLIGWWWLSFELWMCLCSCKCSFLELSSGGNSCFLFFIFSLSLRCILCIVWIKDLLRLKRCKETCPSNYPSADRLPW